PLTHPPIAWLDRFALAASLMGCGEMDARAERGLEIAATMCIVRKGSAWLVPSQSGKRRYTVRAGTEPRPDRANDAADVALHEGALGSCGDQRRIDFRLVAAARDVGPIRRGQGGVDLRYRALGAGMRAFWHSGEHGFVG